MSSSHRSSWFGPDRPVEGTVHVRAAGFDLYELERMRREVKQLHARIAELTAEAERLRTERDTARACGVTDVG